ncbi:MAG: hypothetical protein ACJ8GW_10110 [Massilia sp.]
MPNCDFYATPKDQLAILEWLFAEKTCRVFEIGSAPDTPLEEFFSAQDVLARFDRVLSNGKLRDVYLQLYVIDAGPPFVPTRIAINPSASGATFKYAASGWGLVQLYLSAPNGEYLSNSHTNHNSVLRAERSANTTAKLEDVRQWDFKKITAFSSRLNRKIKSLSVAKIGSQVVFADALALWTQGVRLGPFAPANSSLIMHSR